MLILFGHIVLLSTFELLVKRGLIRRMDMAAIGTLSFVFAAPLALFLLPGPAGPTLGWGPLGLGTLMGACYFTSFFLVLYSIHHQGVAATRAFMQLALLIPVLFSILWWNEHPQGIQFLGIIIAVGSLILLDARGDLALGTRASLRWHLAGIFALVGTARVIAKTFTEMKVPEETPFFLIGVFASAGTAGVVKLLIQRPAISLRGWLWGSGLGALNVMQTLFLVRALHRLPGIIAFPAAACGSLALTTLAGNPASWRASRLPASISVWQPRALPYCC